MSFRRQHFDTSGEAVLNWLRYCSTLGVLNRKVCMKRLALLALGLTMVGCARPGEFGYTPAYTASENEQHIARTWDLEGKQLVDDVDHALLLTPQNHLSEWNVR